jgi:hypothetical protein
MSTTLIVPTGTPITPDLSNVSMADYRASREKPAEAAVADPAPVAGAVQPLGDKPVIQEAAAAVTDDDDPDAGEPAAGATEADKAKRKGGWQRKIDKLQGQVEILTQQLAGKTPAAEGGDGADAEAARAAAAAEPTFDKPEPKIENFESLTEFTKAHTEWVLDGRDFARGIADARAAFDKQMTELVDGWKTRKTEALTRLTDYAEVTAQVDDIQLPKPHQRLFLESEFGPDLAYQLAKDRPALEKFAQLSPEAAAKEFGRLEGKFEAAKAATSATSQPTTRTVSKAPAPVRPLVGGTTPGAAGLDVKTASLADYRRAREAGRRIAA